MDGSGTPRRTWGISARDYDDVLVSARTHCGIGAGGVGFMGGFKGAGLCSGLDVLNLA